jgi:hypothetical protein
LAQSPDEILQAGLHPTYDQLGKEKIIVFIWTTYPASGLKLPTFCFCLEMYAYHLPAATLSNLVDIFISLR